jgi:hypothetical protein
MPGPDGRAGDLEDADAVIVTADSFAYLMSMEAKGGGGYLVGQPLASPARPCGSPLASVTRRQSAS